MKKLVISLIAVAGLSFGAMAQDDAAAEDTPPPAPQVNSLDELLSKVREGKIEESAEHRAREQQFRTQLDQQERLLAEARQEKAREEATSARLEQNIRDNEERIVTLQGRRDERLGRLKELFGVLQQVAGDLRSVITGSLVSVQASAEGVDRLAGIETLIEKASQSSTLPSIEEIEVLWFELQREMIESGKVVTFQAPVVSLAGEQETVALTRVGDFNLVANGKYYDFQTENGKVVELGRQPGTRFTSTVSGLESAGAGQVVPFGLDPTRGQLLTLFIQKPSIMERVHQGGEVGYLILALGAVGILFVLERFFYLFMVTQKVRGQVKSGTADAKNPLGRVLMVYEDNKNVDVETLELKLDEAILKETPKLERFLVFIKLISAVAPLFGLLGTVTGMIETFQAITLFGTGDPKLMAGGISQALVTTVLGLVVAIPTLLLHTFVAGMSKRVVHILEEQSAGIIAVHAEKESANA